MNSFSDDQEFLLIDILENQTYDIKVDSVIEFHYENGQTENRFDLLFDYSTDINNSNLITSQIGIFVNNDRLYLSHAENIDENSVIQVYDLLGQKVVEQQLNQPQDGIPLMLSSAYYIMKLKTVSSYRHQVFFVP